MTSACSSGFPCEKFNRNTFAPERNSARIVCGSREAGPIVATIFVRFCTIFSMDVAALFLVTGRLLRRVARTQRTADEIARSARPPLSGAFGGELSSVAANSRLAGGVSLYRARQFVATGRERERFRRRDRHAFAQLTSLGGHSTDRKTSRRTGAARTGTRTSAARATRRAASTTAASQPSRVGQNCPERSAQPATGAADHSAAATAADAKHRRTAARSAAPGRSGNDPDRRTGCRFGEGTSNRGPLTGAVDRARRSGDPVAAPTQRAPKHQAGGHVRARGSQTIARAGQTGSGRAEAVSCAGSAGANHACPGQR